MTSNDAADFGAEQLLAGPDDRKAIAAALDHLAKDRIVQRIWSRDPTVWKSDPGHQKIISNALGWLTVARAMRERLDEINEFRDAVRRDGFRHVLLLGMGGSSLCPEVLRRTFGRVAGYPELLVLDSTVPASIRAVERRIDPATTLFIVSSKSGTTTEPQVFMEYFYDKVARTSRADPGGNFVAITDSGTALEQTGRERTFRRVFSNPADIGGRYSALSYFGMLPAALAGYDVAAMLDFAGSAMQACSAETNNPGAQLGAALGTLALRGRNKLTFVVPPPIDSLGLWTEQLIAESTGKEGKGILPVAGEPLGNPDVYGDDRIFVYIGRPGPGGSEVEDRLRDLAGAGHPVIVRRLDDPRDLGSEFFIWEFATAVAGALIGLDPFDQPNVQESKDNTNRLLNAYVAEGTLHVSHLAPEVTWERDDETNSRRGAAIQAAFNEFLNVVEPGHYVAIGAYIDETDEHDALLEELRLAIRDRFRVATTVGYGPRYLHSTGQFHKGGPGIGVFVQIAFTDRDELAIPGRPYTFEILKEAQRLGDFEALTGRSLPAIRFDLDGDVGAGLAEMIAAVSAK